MQFDQQIQSTVPTGVAPFTVASTTVVTNLNANFLNGFGPSAFAWAVHDHTSSQITDSTAAGRTLLTSPNAESQRRSLGISDISGNPTVDIEAVAYHRTRINGGGTVSTRRRLNLIAGSGVSLSIGDDPASDETDVTVSSSVTPGTNWGLNLLAWCVIKWNGTNFDILSQSNVWYVTTINTALDKHQEINFMVPLPSADYIMESSYVRPAALGQTGYNINMHLYQAGLSTVYKAYVVIGGTGNAAAPELNEIFALKFWSTAP